MGIGYGVFHDSTTKPIELRIEGDEDAGEEEGLTSNRTKNEKRKEEVYVRERLKEEGEGDVTISIVEENMEPTIVHSEVPEAIKPQFASLYMCLSRIIDEEPDLRLRNAPIKFGPWDDRRKIGNEVIMFSRPARSRQRASVLLPNPYLMSHVFEDFTFASRHSSIPFERASHSFFFRGDDGGSIIPRHNKRLVLCDAVRSESDLCDCKLTENVSLGPKDFDDLVRKRNLFDEESMSEDDWFQHRFIFDVDGLGSSSWNQFANTLTAGRVSVRFESEFEEHWHCKTREGMEFLKCDRSNVLDVVRSVTEAESIDFASRGREFARKNLTRSQIDRDVFLALLKWKEEFEM